MVDPRHESNPAAPRDVTDPAAALTLAREKLTEALATQWEQRQAFESDELFMYLWRRGWNTSAYQASSIVRLLDGWIARFTDFEQARKAYWMLNEIPERLRSRIDALEADLDSAPVNPLA